MVLPPKPIHPKGEPTELSKQLKPASLEIETFGKFSKTTAKPTW